MKLHEALEQAARSQYENDQGIENGVMTVRLTHDGTNYTFRMLANLLQISERVEKLRKDAASFGTGHTSSFKQCKSAQRPISTKRPTVKAITKLADKYKAEGDIENANTLYALAAI